MKFELDIGTITIDDKLLTAERLAPKMEPAMHDMLDRHRENYDAGKGPDGSSQKQYSESYKRAIKAGRVQAGKGEVKKHSTVPNLQISGSMLASQDVIKKTKALEIAFINNDEAQKASWLRDKGFKLSYFGDKDKKSLIKAAYEFIAKDLKNFIKIQNPR